MSTNSPQKEESSEAPEGGVAASTKASSLLGVAAALGLMILINVLVARHYRRWDWTSAHLYSLSESTKTTLHALSEPVQISVLLSSSDPLTVSVKHLLSAYGAETDKLDIQYIDPDKHPAEFLAFQQKYGLLAGRTEDGRVIADAAIVVVKGDKKWFLTPTDLVDVSEADEGKSRPRLEQGITTAIRSVFLAERSRVCFSKGHGELATDDPGPRGLGELRHQLERNNVDIGILDSAALDAKADLWHGCSLVIVAMPVQPFSEKEGQNIAAYLTSGGNAFLLINPIADADQKRILPTGLEPVANLGGVEMRRDLVFEQDKASRIPSGMGEAFFAQAKPHPITEGLMGNRAAGAKLLFLLSQSLGKIPTSPVQPAELLVTSKEAFGMADFFSWNATTGIAEKRPGDHEGPLAVAMAAELPKPAGSKEAHGPRLVIVGSASIAQGQSWQEPALHGGAYFLESAISWLTSKPQIVDIPTKPSISAGLRITADSLRQVTNYVTLYIPLSAALVGLAIYLRRKSTERRQRVST